MDKIENQRNTGSNEKSAMLEGAWDEAPPVRQLPRFHPDTDREATVTRLTKSVCEKMGLPDPDVSRPVLAGATRGRPWWRSEQPPDPYRRIERWAERRLTVSAQAIADRVSVSAVVVSMVATIGCMLAGVAMALSHFQLGLTLLVTFGVVEAFDAVFARDSKTPRRDVFLDYLLDRIADLALFGGVAVGFAMTGAPLAAALSVGILVLSSLSSYARAQGEALDFVSASRFGRFERLAALGLAVAIAAVAPAGSTVFVVVPAIALGLGLLITLVTFHQRVMGVIRQSPAVEINVPAQWDEESFIPRLLSQLLEDSGTKNLVVMSDRTRLTDRDHAELVVLVDRGPSGSGRLRARKVVNG